jgi:hypothetical protein
MNYLTEQVMIEALTWGLGACGTIILILLGIVGYFLKENLGAVDALTTTVSRLDRTLGVVQSLYNETTETAKKRLDAHAEQLDRQSIQLEKHDVYIQMLKEKCNEKTDRQNT